MFFIIKPMTKYFITCINNVINDVKNNRIAQIVSKFLLIANVSR